MTKHEKHAPELAKEPARPSMGLAPAVLSKRPVPKLPYWCPIENIEFDHYCDPFNPKVITYNQIVKAKKASRHEIPPSPIRRSKCCDLFRMDLYYKLEIYQHTGSYKIRPAYYSLLMMHDSEKSKAGVITASTGNWGLVNSYLPRTRLEALASYSRQFEIPIYVVLPENSFPETVHKCRKLGATVILHGKDYKEASRRACVIAREENLFFLNGTDHPNVIAADGSIGLEIMEQIPDADVIIVPVGGGGLIAGIAEAAKHIKPDILIYGVEPEKSCCFFKAMAAEMPYATNVASTFAESLVITTAGCNAFCTAQSMIDKMVLVTEDCIARGALHFLEVEKCVVEGAGAAVLGALLAIPDICPELIEKKVVCVISGGNIAEPLAISRAIDRAKEVEGRLIRVKVHAPEEIMLAELAQLMEAIRYTGGQLLHISDPKEDWPDLHTRSMVMSVETRNLNHARHMKSVIERHFPKYCYFDLEAYGPLPTCYCFPKKINM